MIGHHLHLGHQPVVKHSFFMIFILILDKNFISTFNFHFYLIENSWSYLITALRLLLQAKVFDGPLLFATTLPLLFAFGTEIRYMVLFLILLRNNLNVNLNYQPNKASADLPHIILAMDFNKSIS